MIRGTTPSHTFTLPFSADIISKMRIIYKQNDDIILVKTLDDCAVDGNTFSYKLTQEETLLFDSEIKVDIQVRVLTTGNDSLASRIYKIGVGALLEDGVLA